jgi:transcriptional regulator with XRE-family HTH domain
VTEGKPRSPLGEEMMRIAGRYNLRYTRSIERRIKQKMGYGPSHPAISKWLDGSSTPTPENLTAFADAFDATLEERIRLAWAVAYRKPFPGEETR